jgi:hypothetical protein
MTSSKGSRILGLDPLALAILTPGPLGHNDYASPERKWSSPGTSPGPLGINDHATPFCQNTAKEEDGSALSTEMTEVLTPTSGASKRLMQIDFVEAANALGADVSAAIVKAFAEVESGGRSGFGPGGLPIIAYEGHVFRRLTKKRYDAGHPLLSYPYTNKAGPQWRQNNRTHTQSWQTLRAAMQLDFLAALQSCSWGMFQVMGFNFKSCGFDSVTHFVAAMKAGEREQLGAFIGFCKSRSGLCRALADKDYQKIALLYNGVDYGNYDELIERSYKKYAGG